VQISQVPMNGLTTYIPFDGSSAADVMGGVGTATVTSAGTGAIAYSSTNFKAGNACLNLTTNTANNNANFAALSYTATQACLFTASMWINASTPATLYQTFLSHGNSSTTNGNNKGAFFVGIDATASTITAGINIGTTYCLTTAASTISANTWHHVCVTASMGGFVTLYVNGSQTGTPTSIPNGLFQTSGSLNLPVNMLRIGTDAAYNNCNAFKGLIDDVRIYNRVLSASEITALAGNVGIPQAPTANLTMRLTFDNTTADAMGTLSMSVTGTMQYVPGMVGSSAIYFANEGNMGNSAASNRLQSGATINSTVPMTVSLWLNATKAPTSGVAYPTPFAIGIVSPGTDTLQIYFNYVNSTQFTATAWASSSVTSSTLNINTWYHMVLVFTPSSSLYFYINGSYVASTTSGVLAGTTGNSLRFADNISGSTRPYAGYIDDFRIYNTALTPAQVAGLYYSSPNTGYVLYQQPIEGLNLADLAWGTSSALPATVSAWIKNNSAASNAQALTLAVNNGNQGLAAWFPFENGSAADVMGGVTGPAVTGTLALSSSTYKVGSSALNLTANTAGGTATTYLDYSTSAPALPLTCSMWIYLASSASTYVMPFTFADSSGNANGGWGFELVLNASAQLYTDLGIGVAGSSVTTSYGIAASASTAISISTWTHVALTINLATQTHAMFINGVQVGINTTLPTSGAIVSLNTSAITQVRFGCQTPSKSYALSGYLDDFRIYNKVLTPAQIQQLYLNNASTTTQSPYLLPRSVLYQTPSLPANAWSRVSVTLPGDIAGTWAADNTLGLNLALCLGAGANYASSNLAAASGNSSSVWQNALVYTASNQVFGASNAFLGSLGNSLLLTGVQLERGQAASPYEFKPLPAELAAAQRYYETSYDQDTAVGTATNAGAVAWAVVASNRPSYHVAYKTPKRSAPSITLYNPATANTTGLRNIGSSSSGAGTLEASGTTGFRVYWPSGNTGQVVGDTISGHFVANAEL
jgi:hypothetical protein